MTKPFPDPKHPPRSKYADRHFIILRNDDLSQLELEADALVKQGFDPFSLNENEQVDGSTLYILPMCRAPDHDDDLPPGMAELMEAPGDMIITPANVQEIVRGHVQLAVQEELSRIRVTPVPITHQPIRHQPYPGSGPTGALTPGQATEVIEHLFAGQEQLMLTKQDAILCQNCLIRFVGEFGNHPEFPTEQIQALVLKLGRIENML